MTKRKGDNKMAESNASASDESPKVMEGSLEEVAGGLPSGLKPKLDKIFAEVEDKLPDIDFDLSDIDSDGDDVTPMTFSHPMKSLEEDKDLDTSQTSESLAELSALNPPINDYNLAGSLDNSLTDPTPENSSLVNFFDNDLAYELQQGGVNVTSSPSDPKPTVNSWAEIPSSKTTIETQTVSSWADIPVPAEKDKNKIEKQALEKPPSGSDRKIAWADNDTESEKERDTRNNDPDSSDNRITTGGSLTLNSYDDKGIRRSLDRETNRNKDREIASTVISPRAPVLSTTALDNIDIDTLLQNLNTDQQKPARQAWGDQPARPMSVTRPISAPAGGVGKNNDDNKNSGLTLIQKLAQMSMTQYGEDLTDIDPSTGARKKNTSNASSCKNAPGQDSAPMPRRDNDAALAKRYDEDGTKDEGTWSVVACPPQPAPKKTTSSCGTSTSNSNEPLRVITPRVPPKTPPPVQPVAGNNLPGLEATKGNKEPTVFIDLRNFEQKRQEEMQNIERVQKILGIQKPPPTVRQESDDSDSEGDNATWSQQRKQFKQTTGKPVRKPPPGPSDKPPVYRQPPRVINLLDQPSRASGNQAATPGTGAGAREDEEARRQREAKDAEREKQLEIIKKLREKQESERQAKLRLQKRLEALRPMASVSGRHNPAENTPTVFDLDASYEPSPRSLPPVLEGDTDCVLLTINLSSNGEIVLHRGSGNKSVDTGTGLSASYTTLLTWLLSLVPSNFSYLQHQHSNKNSADSANTGTGVPPSPWILPFYVVGLQQVLLDGQLCLMVAVTPVEQFDAKSIPSKNKKNKKSQKAASAAFQQHLQKYFSTNTLHTVCPWLQNMVSMDVMPSGLDDKPEYIYRPPLPNITTKPLSTFIHLNPDPQASGKVFNMAVGFFWQTVDSDEFRLDQEIHDDEVSFDTQNTLSLIYKKIYQDQASVMGIFNRVLQLGLDIGGIRLVYPTSELMNLQQLDNSTKIDEMSVLNNVGAVLALCIRGTAARSVWLDAVGPSDPALARRTDPNSLCALYGGESRDECLLFCPRTPARVQADLVRWFGGRVPPGNVIDVGTPYTKKDTLRSGSPKGRRNKKVSFADQTKTSGESSSNDFDSTVHRPLATLTATSRSEILFVMSPLVPPKCFGIILASCQRRGFQVTGIKRMRLSTKKSTALGITAEGLKAFCPGSTSTESFDGSLAGHVDRQGHGQMQECTFPSTVLQLLKENASHSAASLVEDCMVQLTLHGIMGTLQKREGFPLESVHMFQAARYSDSLHTLLGGDFSKCFDHEIQINPSYVVPRLYTNPELEQITVLLLLGHNILKSSGLYAGKLLGMVPVSRHQAVLPFSEGLELLGMKWLPSLSLSQAKEVTPCEIGDKLWKDSLHTLTNEPCLVLALRGVNVFAKLESIVQPRPSTNPSSTRYDLETIHARTAEEAYTYIRLFFTERELFSDPLARPMLPYIPHYLTRHELHLNKHRSSEAPTYPIEESIFELMLSGPRPFVSFLVIKPRAFQKHLSKILKKITQEGFKTVALKLQVLSEEQARRLIPHDTQEGEVEKHVQHLQSGPSLCVCLERENAVWRLLELLGPDDPQSARRLSQFYWRGVFGSDTVMNALYCSRSYKAAIEDQQLFFPDGLCCEETDTLAQEMVPCPALDQDIDFKYSDNRKVIHSLLKGEAPDSSHNLLLQTTCVVLSPMLMKKIWAHYGFVEVIEGLIHQGFEMVGGRMVWFTQEQAEQFLCVVEAGSFQQVPLLVSGPSIILALQRDNAVLAFDTILRETFSTESSQGKSTTDSILHKYGRLILRPTDIKQADNALRFFFNELIPGSAVKIESSSG